MKRILSVILTLVLCCATVGCVPLEGCDFFSQIELFKSDISGNVGDTINVEQYINADTSAGISLKSSNEAVAAVIGVNTIKLFSEGKSTITINVGMSSARLTVAARYADPTSVELFASDQLLQMAGATSPITFYATLNEGARQPSRYEWHVNDIKQSQTSHSFCLGAQAGAGEYVVRVSANGLSAQQSLVVFNDGATALLEGGESAFVNDSLTYTLSNLTGISKIEWFVNNQLSATQISDEGLFVFKPQYAGNYKISARVNGSSALCANQQDFVALAVKGEAYPQNLKIDAISQYPKILLSWSNRNDALAQVSISPIGSADTISIDNINLSDGQIDIAQYVEITDSFWVSSIFESVYFEGLAPLARQYLQQKYVGGSLYMRSQEDIQSLFQYMIVFRPNKIQSGAQTTSTLSFYMGYDSTISVDRLANSLVDSLNMTGSYRWQINGTLKKNTINELSIIFYAENEPDNTLTTTKKALQLVAPALSKTGNTMRFAYQDYQLSPVKIATSDQLFFALEKGYKPDLVPSSPAQAAFDSAQAALKMIIDQQMTDSQRALAIYDYIMFLVTYDTDATASDKIADAVKKSAYYLEGVFDQGFAVCDGISKAFSLMCNMIGIDCVRVTGLVLQGSSWYNHAWNKVKIEGKWYTADATWDISERTLALKTYKLCSKTWFLLGESDYYLSRYESGSTYPIAETFGYNYFAKGGFYIHDDNVAAQILLLNDSINKSYTKEYYVGSTKHTANYFAVEIGVAPTLFSGIDTRLYGAIEKNFNLVFTQSTVIIAIK